jgi:hypothetical protein
MSDSLNPPEGIVKPGEHDRQSAIGESDLPHWENATRIRKERSLWVIIWLARERRYRAYPKFRAPAGMTSANGTTPEVLLADMDRIEEAAHRPRGRSRARGTP